VIEPLKITPTRKAHLEAVEMTARNAEELAEWCDGYLSSTVKGEPMLVVYGEVGSYFANPGDFVIKYVGGNFGVITSEHFRDTYTIEDE
jgi:hypothetical protein